MPRPLEKGDGRSRRRSVSPARRRPSSSKKAAATEKKETGRPRTTTDDAHRSKKAAAGRQRTKSNDVRRYSPGRTKSSDLRRYITKVLARLSRGHAVSTHTLQALEARRLLSAKYLDRLRRYNSATDPADRRRRAERLTTSLRRYMIQRGGGITILGNGSYGVVYSNEDNKKDAVKVTRSVVSSSRDLTVTNHITNLLAECPNFIRNYTCYSRVNNDSINEVERDSLPQNVIDNLSSTKIKPSDSLVKIEPIDMCNYSLNTEDFVDMMFSSYDPASGHLVDWLYKNIKRLAEGLNTLSSGIHGDNNFIWSYTDVKLDNILCKGDPNDLLSLTMVFGDVEGSSRLDVNDIKSTIINYNRGSINPFLFFAIHLDRIPEGIDNGGLLTAYYDYVAKNNIRIKALLAKAEGFGSHFYYSMILEYVKSHDVKRTQTMSLFSLGLSLETLRECLYKVANNIIGGIEPSPKRDPRQLLLFATVVLPTIQVLLMQGKHDLDELSFVLTQSLSINDTSLKANMQQYADTYTHIDKYDLKNTTDVYKDMLNKLGIHAPLRERVLFGTRFNPPAAPTAPLPTPSKSALEMIEERDDLGVLIGSGAYGRVYNHEGKVYKYMKDKDSEIVPENYKGSGYIGYINAVYTAFKNIPHVSLLEDTAGVPFENEIIKSGPFQLCIGDLGNIYSLRSHINTKEQLSQFVNSMLETLESLIKYRTNDNEYLIHGDIKLLNMLLFKHRDGSLEPLIHDYETSLLVRTDNTHLVGVKVLGGNITYSSPWATFLTLNVNVKNKFKIGDNIIISTWLDAYQKLTNNLKEDKSEYLEYYDARLNDYSGELEMSHPLLALRQGDLYSMALAIETLINAFIEAPGEEDLKRITKIMTTHITLQEIQSTNDPLVERIHNYKNHLNTYITVNSIKSMSGGFKHIRQAALPNNIMHNQTLSEPLSEIELYKLMYSSIYIDTVLPQKVYDDLKIIYEAEIKRLKRQSVVPRSLTQPPPSSTVRPTRNVQLPPLPTRPSLPVTTTLELGYPPLSKLTDNPNPRGSRGLPLTRGMSRSDSQSGLNRSESSSRLPLLPATRPGSARGTGRLHGGAKRKKRPAKAKK